MAVEIEPPAVFDSERNTEYSHIRSILLKDREIFEYSIEFVAKWAIYSIRDLTNMFSMATPHVHAVFIDPPLHPSSMEVGVVALTQVNAPG